LALDLYLRRGIVPQIDPELLEVSSILNRLRGRGKVNDEVRFRNPNGVHMKLANFRSQDQPGKGLQHGNHLEPIVWDRFKNQKESLAREVARIKTGL